jgi:hypothetical protein
VNDIIAHQKPLLLGVMALPAFHTMGFYMQLLLPLLTASTTALFAPRFPHAAVVPSPANTLEALQSTGSNFASVAPTFIEVCNDLHLSLILVTNFGITRYGLVNRNQLKRS